MKRGSHSPFEPRREGGTGRAFAFAVLVTTRLAQHLPESEYATPRVLNDLGNLLLTFTMFWAYVAFSQFLLIWAGNLPEEIPWYLDRIRGGWGVIASLDFVFHWFIPFTLLLSADLKRNKERLIMVCKIMVVEMGDFGHNPAP